MPTVEGAVDDGDYPVAWVVVEEVLFEDGFSSARFAEDEAEAALLGVEIYNGEGSCLPCGNNGLEEPSCPVLGAE